MVAVDVWVTEFSWRGTVTLKDEDGEFTAAGFRKGRGSGESQAMGALAIGLAGKEEVLGHGKEPHEGRPWRGANLPYESSAVILRAVCVVQCSIHGWACR